MSKYLDAELSIFQDKFKSHFKSPVPLLNIILKYIIKTKGKQMRPRFVLSSAAMFGPINENSYHAASLIELLHTATLVHDDVVDESYQRRGFFSVNALWKNKIAVLAGDYLLSKGMLNALETDNVEILKIVSKAVKLMSEGELLQLEKARKLDITEEVYFDIINNKTASLLASACATGAYSVTEDLAVTKKMWDFGEKVGLCFQMKDDLFDYGIQDVGKPLGIDIKEKKLTLPIIFTLNHSNNKERDGLKKMIKNNKKGQHTQKIIELVKSSGGIEYTINVMNSIQEQAMNILYEFPKNDGRDELERLLLFTTQRTK